LNDQAGHLQAPLLRIVDTDEIAAALDSAGLRPDRAVIVLVGGAGGMGGKDFETVAQVLRDEVVPVAERRNAVVIDGGTDSGVMQLIGRARSALGGRFPLIGVAAEGTVLVPGAGTPSPDAVELEPNHTLFLLVPGMQWGDESRWMMDVAGVAAGARSPCCSTVGRSLTPMSRRAWAAVARWWCSPEAVAQPTPLPRRERAMATTTAPSRSRLPR
jgi:hypothetical protein